MQKPPPTKKSNGICLVPGAAGYAQTKDFIPFVTVEDCLKSGGHLPRR